MKKLPAQPASTYSMGLSLIELLIVIAIIGAVASQMLHSWWTFSANQALSISADKFADNIKIAHIYAREAKDNYAWGVIRNDDHTYKVVSGSISSIASESLQTLESRIKFIDPNFTIWFEKGTGQANIEDTIELLNANGKKIKVDIFRTGLVEISGIY